jgi:nucleoside-diphosphate-sugar epimerase
LRSSVDPTQATLTLGWHPKVKLATGLEETLRFFEASGRYSGSR